MDKNEFVVVKNRNNGVTGYVIPERNIQRQFAPNETKKISLDELQALQFVEGGDYILKNLLIVNNKEALSALNMEVEPEYFYDEAKIRDLLFNGSMDQLLDFLDFATEGAIELAKDIAVKEQIPDIRKREAISKKTGFNINNAINVNAILEEETPAEEVATPKRRVPIEEPEATPQRRVAPKYNVVSQG